MNPKYAFEVNEDNTQCKIFLLRPYKYIGQVTKVIGGRATQKFAPGITWLPIADALEAMKDITKEESILMKLGV